jgi:hypothetical protein
MNTNLEVVEIQSIKKVLDNVKKFDFSDVYEKTDKRQDKVYAVADLGNGLSIRLIESKKGLVVDVRKAYMGHYTQRGLRLPALKFKEGSAKINEVIEDMLYKLKKGKVPIDDEDDNKKSKGISLDEDKTN